MDKLWRFYDGAVSGVVAAETSEEALALADAYLKGHFSDYERPKGEDLQIWPCTEDDDYDKDFPSVLAVSY